MCVRDGARGATVQLSNENASTGINAPGVIRTPDLQIQGSTKDDEETEE